MDVVAATRIADADTLLHLVPPVVRSRDPVPMIVGAMARDPVARAAFVVDGSGRLAGVVAQQDLDTDMIALLQPGSLEGLGPRELLRLAHGLDETAAGLMREPCALRTRDTIGAALTLMRERRLESAAIVGDDGELLGYVALFEVLAALLGVVTPAGTP